MAWGGKNLETQVAVAELETTTYTRIQPANDCVLVAYCFVKRHISKKMIDLVKV